MKNNDTQSTGDVMIDCATAPIDKIYAKIIEVMKAVTPIAKANKNEQQGYKFRGIDDIYNELHEHLATVGIFFTSEILEKTHTERPARNGGVLTFTVLTIKWRVYADDGSHVETVTVGEAMDSGDKSCNKAMSTAYKYAFMQLFCIPTDDIKDTEHDSPEPAPAPHCCKCASTDVRPMIIKGKEYLVCPTHAPADITI